MKDVETLDNGEINVVFGSLKELKGMRVLFDDGEDIFEGEIGEFSNTEEFVKVNNCWYRADDLKVVDILK